jgi:transcription antitermination factor NusG
VTNPGCQARATGELYQLGYRTFYPKIKKWVSHARVRKAVEKPLLGRYVFVEVDHPRQSFGSVRACNGVEGIISSLGVPTPFPSRLVEDFIRRQLANEWDFVTQEPVRYVDANGDIQVRENPPTPIGARVAIVEGEFNAALATVTNRKHGKLHCKILDTNLYAQLRERGIRAA